jgi:hypothetical protein
LGPRAKGITDKEPRQVGPFPGIGNEGREVAVEIALDQEEILAAAIRPEIYDQKHV